MDDYVGNGIDYISNFSQSDGVDHHQVNNWTVVFLNESYNFLVKLNVSTLVNQHYIDKVNNRLLHQKSCLTSIIYET